MKSVSFASEDTYNVDSIKPEISTPSFKTSKTVLSAANELLETNNQIWVYSRYEYDTNIPGVDYLNHDAVVQFPQPQKILF